MQEICALRICGAASGGENGRSENRATVPQGERRQTVRVLWEGGCEMIYIGIDPGKDGAYAVMILREIFTKWTARRCAKDV